MYPIFEPAEIPALARTVCRTLLPRDGWPYSAEDLDRARKNEVNLLVGTAAAESNLQHRRQHGGGPAKGLWQMEPATAHDIFDNYLMRKPGRYRALMLLWLCLKHVPVWIPNVDDLAWHLEVNDPFACAMCRIHYLRVPEAIPDTLEQQAQYWKKHYNTPQGKGTMGHYVSAWNACECEKLIAEAYEESDWGRSAC